MKRNLINTSVTDKAKEIYDNLPSHRKGAYVSSAIEEKHARETGTSIEQRVERLEQKVQELLNKEGV